MVLNIHRNVYLSMNLFIFRRHSPREPAKIVCDNEQGDLFYSEGPQGKFRQPQLTQFKNRERIWKKRRWMDRKYRNWDKKEILGSSSDLLQASKGEHLSAPGSQQRGPSFHRPQYTSSNSTHKQFAISRTFSSSSFSSSFSSSSPLNNKP